MTTPARITPTDRPEENGRQAATSERPDVLVVVGRPTFDLSSAQPLVEAAINSLDIATVVVGGGRILQSPEEISAAIETLPRMARHLLVLFASFADSRLAAAAVDHFDHVDGIILWSLPEPWTGGRLRRNSLCGATLAAHRLVAEGHVVAGLHEDPGPGTEQSVQRALTRVRTRAVRRVAPTPGQLDTAERLVVDDAVASVRSTHLGVVGAAPAGFEPCEVDATFVPAGVTVERTTVHDLFAASASPLSLADEHTVTDLRDMAGNDVLPRDAVEHSVALQGGAERLAQRNQWNALAIRCWPECFDEWCGAACAAMALLNERGLPAACEADALGALSMRLMQSLSGEPTFLADLVEIDEVGDRVAFWHCGVAPRTMADPAGDVRVALHSNRQQPLVFDFALAEAPVTMLRISKSGGIPALVVGEGRLTGEHPFAGTSGVVQLTGSAQSLIDTMIEEGLEHHVVLAIGHHQRLLEAVAAELDLPVIHLT